MTDITIYRGTIADKTINISTYKTVIAVEIWSSIITLYYYLNDKLCSYRPLKFKVRDGWTDGPEYRLTDIHHYLKSSYCR